VSRKEDTERGSKNQPFIRETAKKTPAKERGSIEQSELADSARVVNWAENAMGVKQPHQRKKKKGSLKKRKAEETSWSRTLGIPGSRSSGQQPLGHEKWKRS